jgi:uncharacterized Fe-S cluster-containing radical SAM superfamily protein
MIYSIPMVAIIKKPNKKEVTTILGKDVHKIIEKYSDREKYQEYRRKWELASKLSYVPDFPLQIDFELNYSCNFTCEMCTWSAENTSGKGKKTWFSFEAYKEIIDEGVKKGLKAIRLNYINEPLIRKDIIDFIEYAKKKGVLDIYLSTNGSLLKEKFILKLINSGLTRIQVSIDAFTKPTFDKIRQGGNFSDVVKNTLNFLKIRKDLNKELPTLRVNFVRTDLNKHEYEDFISFWSNKADCIGIQDLVDIMKPSKTKNKLKKFNCAQPFYHLTVRYDGTILPCCTFFAAKLPISRLKTNNKVSDEANLHKIDYDKLPIRNIADTWFSEEIKYLRKIHIDGNYHLNSVCKECVSSTSNYDDTV